TAPPAKRVTTPKRKKFFQMLCFIYKFKPGAGPSHSLSNDPVKPRRVSLDQITAKNGKTLPNQDIPLRNPTLTISRSLDLIILPLHRLKTDDNCPADSRSHRLIHSLN